MGEFIVSARKYRPATFASVVGQSAITTTLKNAVMQDQVAQAFLFCGPRGVGKTTCARILAKTINCTARTPEGEACNECESCKSFNESTSFNIFELDAASNNSVEDIRNLTEQVRIPPQGAKYKVYIIDEVHMLSSSAFNAFLKTLEEPPAYAKFILATTEKHKIIPTILSRCQVFDFKRIMTEDIVQHLAYVAQQEQISFEESALRVIAQKADGGLRDALSIFDQEALYTSGHLTYEKVTENLNVLDIKQYMGMTDSLYRGDIAQALVTYNEIMDKGFDGQHFLDGMCNHLRNLMVCRSPISIKLLDLGEQMSQLYTEQVKQTDPMFLLNCLDIFNRCSGSYKTSNNKRLHVEVSLMMICKSQGKVPTTSNSNSGGNNHTTKETTVPNADSMTKKVTNAETTDSNEPATSHAASTKTTSIKDLMENIGTNSQQTEKKKVDSAQPGIIADKEDAMTLDDAIIYCKVNWENILTEYGNNNHAATSLLSDQKNITFQDRTISIHVENSVAQKSIQEILKELLQGIWEKTGIRFEADFIISEYIAPLPMLNPDEKFSELCKSNPYLKQFKDELKLNVK